MTYNSFPKFLRVGKSPQLEDSRCRKASKEMSPIQSTYYYVSEPFHKKLLHSNLLSLKPRFWLRSAKGWVRSS